MKEKNTMFINFAEYDKIDNELYYEEQLYSIENDFDEFFVDFIKIKTIYKNCQKSFKSNITNYTSI